MSESTRPRRIDHLAIVVRSTDEALRYFRDRLGFPVVDSEEFSAPPVRLTYLDCGNIVIQLIEPTGASPIADALEADGEGIHHVCLASDDPVATAASLADPGSRSPVVGQGRGRRSAFVPGPVRHGVLFECTELRPEDADGPHVLS